MNKSQKHFNTIKDQLHETRLVSIRKPLLVIRHLYNSTSHPDIISALAELGHSVKNIYICPQKNNSDTYNISSHYESYNKKNIHKNTRHTTMPQLLNLRAHKNYCVIVKLDASNCGENHQTNEYTKLPKTEIVPLNALYVGTLNHTSNFKGCLAFTTAFKKSPESRFQHSTQN